MQLQSCRDKKYTSTLEEKESETFDCFHCKENDNKFVLNTKKCDCGNGAGCSLEENGKDDGKYVE